MKALKNKIQQTLLNAIFPTEKFSVKTLRLFDHRLFVYLDQHTNRKIALGRFEKRETEFMCNYLKPTDVCLDIGANIGYYTLLFAAKGKEVISIEPVLQNVALLNLTAALNPDLKIQVLKAAVSDMCGMADFYILEQTSLSGLKLNSDETHAQFYAHISQPVETVTIDALKLDCLDIVKLDVEGSELLALKGMRDTLIRLRPRLILTELVDGHLARYGTSISDVLGYMQELGYSAYQLENSELVLYSGERPENDNFFIMDDNAMLGTRS